MACDTRATLVTRSWAQGQRDGRAVSDWCGSHGDDEDDEVDAVQNVDWLFNGVGSRAVRREGMAKRQR